jgi:hypothetical protein
MEKNISGREKNHLGARGERERGILLRCESNIGQPVYRATPHKHETQR